MMSINTKSSFDRAANSSCQDEQQQDLVQLARGLRRIKRRLLLEHAGVALPQALVKERRNLYLFDLHLMGPKFRILLPLPASLLDLLRLLLVLLHQSLQCYLPFHHQWNKATQWSDNTIVSGIHGKKKDDIHFIFEYIPRFWIDIQFLIGLLKTSEPIFGFICKPYLSYLSKTNLPFYLPTYLPTYLYYIPL